MFYVVFYEIAFHHQLLVLFVYSQVLYSDLLAYGFWNSGDVIHRKPHSPVLGLLLFTKATFLVLRKFFSRLSLHLTSTTESQVRMMVYLIECYLFHRSTISI